MRPTTEAAPRADSLLGQLQWMHRQMQEAAESMRRNGIELPNANWSPPWEHVPDANPSPNHPNQHGYRLAIFSHA
eukprot:8983759-Pyramimonas_sp.AAC.1